VTEFSDPPSAVRAAIRAAGEQRHVLAADFALRLARLGHVREVSVHIAGGPEAAEAVRSVLAELAAPEAPGDAISPADGSEAPPGPTHASQSVREACVRRARACLACGGTFEVNVRHAHAHKFCSAVCRSRHRHRAQAGPETGTRALALPIPFGRVATEETGTERAQRPRRTRE
jgi:hypothetical protein